MERDRIGKVEIAKITLWRLFIIEYIAVQIRVFLFSLANCTMTFERAMQMIKAKE